MREISLWLAVQSVCSVQELYSVRCTETDKSGLHRGGKMKGRGEGVSKVWVPKVLLWFGLIQELLYIKP